MDEVSRQESMRLYDILERVGISDRMRKLRRDTNIREEVGFTLIHRLLDRNMSVYMFGSCIEGTATPEMGSDEDVVICQETFPVVDDIQQAPRGNSYLVVSDGYTKPGYVKLQLVCDGVPLTVYTNEILDFRSAYDCVGRICKKHRYFRNSHFNEHNGPAHTSSNVPGCTDIDLVYALRSRTFPRAAVESLIDCVRSGWLTGNDVEELIGLGCLFVGVGHPASDEKEIEWRVSFSMQERQLMFNLNSTQHKCYVLLKLLKCMLMSESGGVKSLTSYHCKTCLLNVIVKLGFEQWRPENLINCTLICLQELLQYLYNSNCPNFFIKSNNMFEHRMDNAERLRLIAYIRALIQDGNRLFHRIQSDNIGDMMRGNMSRLSHVDIKLRMATYAIFCNAFTSLLSGEFEIYATTNEYSKNNSSRYLSHQICSLVSVEAITDHSVEVTKSATAVLIPVLHKMYAQHLASQAFETVEPGYRRHLLDACARHLKLGMTWDLMSGRLLYATILYRQGNLGLCCDLLEGIERHVTREVSTLCKCYNHEHHFNDHLATLIQTSDAGPDSILKSFIATCVIFPPYQRELIPTALKYEMYRSVCSPPGTSDARLDKWYDLVVVDSKVYVYFMLYLVYKDLNKPGPTSNACHKLSCVLVQDPNLGHRETGYNLLGWIHIQEGRIPAALSCFHQSWRIRPHHNAAKWHVLNLVNRR